MRSHRLEPHRRTDAGLHFVQHGLDVLCTLALRIIGEDGNSFAGSLRELGALPDHLLEQELRVVLGQGFLRFLRDLVRRVVGVDHDEDVVEDVLEVLFEALHRLEEELEPVEGEEVGEHGHEQVVRRHQRVQVQEPEGWRRVEHRIVVDALHFLEHVTQPELARGQRHQRQIDGAHGQVGGDQIEPRHAGPEDHGSERRLLDDRVEERLLRFLALDPRHLLAWPCESRSITRTRWPISARRNA